MIEGRLRLDTWEDKTTGQKRSRLKVVLDNVQFLNRAPGHGGSTAPAHHWTAASGRSGR